MLREFAAAAVLSAVPAVASAVVLGYGFNTLPGTSVAAEPGLAGTVVEDVRVPFSLPIADGIFTGSVQNRVVLADDGTYDFYWRIDDTSFTGTAAARIGQLRLGGFGPSLLGTNANYRTDGAGTVGPDRAFVFEPPFDGSINFLFAGGLPAGTDTRFFFLDTNATAYGLTAIYDLTDLAETVLTDSYATFGPAPGGPVAPVPEPGVLALLGLGTLLLAAGRRASRPKA